MMEFLWCWRCKMDIPMVDDHEWKMIWAALEAGSEKRRDIRIAAALAEYERIAGFKETNFDALFHHRISGHGLPCPRCRKALRTRIAYKCFECGFQIHEPNWSYLFEVRAGAVAFDEEEVVIATEDRTILDRVSPGSELDFRKFSLIAGRAIVRSIETGDRNMSDLNAIRIKLEPKTRFDKIEAGQTVWLWRPAPAAS